MEFVSPVISILTLAAKYAVSPIKNQIKYLCCPENKVEILKDQVKSLKIARDRVQHSVDTAKGNGEAIEQDVDEWLSTVNEKISEEDEKLMQYEEKAKRKCFLGLCPNLWARYRHSVKAEEVAKTVAELLEKGKFDGVSYRVAPQGITATFVKGFEAFESRKLVFNGIMEALKDDRINILGVHGMGGIGKTMLVKEVTRLIKEGKLFDSVVVATVTQTLDLCDIQNQIADLLGLKFEEQSMVGRALRLRKKLKEEKKILIVLDDIWARFDLEEVGIPSGDEHKGCKILLTSRELDVLSSGMNSEKNFTVSPLKGEETWALFKKMAGDVVESCDLQPTAMEVAKKCAGLPIAIATVARALRNKKLFEWKNALLELKRPSSINIKGVAMDVYSAIELSYNYLESEEVKLTFLLCSLLGHNASIEDLLRYVIGMGVFDGLNAIEEARNRVLTLVSTLKTSCLLLDSNSDKRFDIHDVVWDVALSIASRDHHMIVLRKGDELKEWPAKEIKHNCSAISFRYPRIMTELPHEMEGFDLSLFCMHNVGLLEIPTNFFGGTKGLKVLDFSGMHFSSLPVSITHLINLHTLCLHECALQDISLIGELKNLKILSLARSVIEALPKEIAQLTQLRSLNLSGCTKLQLIPPNVLSSLSKLEELYIVNSFVQWEGEVLGNERRNASLYELKHLSHLTTLYIDIPNAQIIPKHLFIETLERYRICIGELEGRFSEYDRSLKLKICTSIHLDHSVRMLLKKTEDLHLAELKGIKHVFGELNDGEGFPHLKKLHIQNSSEVQYITKKKIEFAQLQSMILEGLPQLISFCSEDYWCSTSHEEVAATSCKPLFSKQLLFPHLTSLRLSSISAKRIWHSQLSVKCCCLGSLIIKGCGNLDYLLSPSIARSLAQLTDIMIEDCECLREIISTEEIEEDQKLDVICFPQLKYLKIKNLQNLIKFCSGEYNIEFPSLEWLEIQGCPVLKEFINEPKMEENGQLGMRALFNVKVAVPSLEMMTISNLKNVKMIFDNQLVAGSFCKLRILRVEDCDELLTIFSSKIVGVFQSLEELSVGNCDSLDVIFEVGELDIKETHVVHSQLRELHISLLPELKHVWNKDPQGILTFQNLRKVYIRSCENLENLFPVSIAKDLPQLEGLTLSHCGVEEIVVSEGEGSEQPVEFKFPQMSSLSLTDLRELKCFYGGQHTIVWPMLKKLEITDYSTLLKIVALQLHLGIQERNGSNTPRPLFIVEKVIPLLEELRLRNQSEDISKIRNDQFPADFFHHIKVFNVSGSAILPSHFLQRFYNLESLELLNCNFKDLVSSEKDDAENPDAMPLSGIKKLSLTSFKFLKHIWKRESKLGHILPNLEILEVRRCNDLINFGPSAYFQNLTTLDVTSCKMMINLVTASVVENLLQLTTMKIGHCCRMTEIVANEEEDEGTDEITFSKLQYLELNCLQSLASICPGNYSIKFPCLQELIVNQCPSLKIFSKGVLSSPQLRRVKRSCNDHNGRWAGDLNTTIQHLYAEKVGYHGLYDLTFTDTSPEWIEIWIARNPREILNFKNLGRLEFCNCSSLKHIFTLSMASSLTFLRSLVVEECSTLKDVIREQEIEEVITNNPIFPRLCSIEIKSCSSLRSFYLGSRALEFPMLNSIKITDCPKMSTFVSSFPRDKEPDCGADGDEEPNIAPFFSNKAVCPKLKRLDLSTISIQKIWPEQLLPTSLHLWELDYLKVNGCHNLKYLFPSFMIKQFVQLRKLRIWDCKMMEEVIFMEGLTEEESMSSMLFPKLRSLQLKDLPKLSRFCFENYFEFPCLMYLTLTNCPSLQAFISKSVNAGDEPQIDLLDAQRYNLEVDKMALFNEKVELPRLQALTINGMRHCRKIWPDQITVNSFSNLRRILVESCEKLLTIFPLKMMERLEKLDKLQIVDCDSLEEIFEPQAVITNQSHAVATTQSIVEETMTKFVFPRVSFIRLEKLPQLKRFYSRMHATEWPSLTKMKVIDCGNVDVFASDCPGSVETRVESRVEIPNWQPLFLVNQGTFPVLGELKVMQNDTWHGQVLSTECFRKLKVLELTCIPEKSTALRHYFFPSLPNLEIKLVLRDAPLCQTFQFEGLNDDERHTSALTLLSELRLSKLPELTHLWKEGFQPKAAFCGLKILEVQDCGKLETLAPYLVSFNNLTTLEVSGCHGFINLLTCSTTKSLMQLKRMSIIDCEKIEEIIACDADEMEGAIVFSQLRYLQLSSLPSLTSICLGDHSFEFPTLQKVIVKECPKVKIFCQGDLSTPKLHQLQFTGDDDEEKGRWEGDLKTTVRQLFEEMNVQSSEVTEVSLELPTLE